MNKILFVTFYGLIEYIADIATTFEDNNITVVDFPLLCHLKDTEKSKDEILGSLLSTIKDNEINYVFWFYIPKNYELYFSSIKTQYENVKYIFYNFDDPKSLNIDLLKFGSFMDYFINPIKMNEGKYMCLMNKRIYSLDRYCHLDLLLNEINNTKSNDVSIIVNKFEDHDGIEKNYLHSIIGKILEFCLKNQWSIKLYGKYSLKDTYPDIYKEEVDDLSENQMFSRTTLVILLDYRNNIKRDINYDILHAHIHGKKILTNYHMINDDIISRHDNIHILKNDNIDIIKRIYESDLVECDECKRHDADEYGIDHWVKEIIKIVSE